MADSYIEKVLNLAVKKGLLHTREVVKESIPRQYLKIACDRELLKRIGRGLYSVPDYTPSKDASLPVSWKGTIAQYAGRLHRDHHNKSEVIIYDYADLNIPILAKIFDRRLAGYRAIGYEYVEINRATEDMSN